jgi:hypothetical protein
MRPFQFTLRRLFLLVSVSAFILYVVLYLNAHATLGFLMTPQIDDAATQ